MSPFPFGGYALDCGGAPACANRSGRHKLPGAPDASAPGECGLQRALQGPHHEEKGAGDLMTALPVGHTLPVVDARSRDTRRGVLLPAGPRLVSAGPVRGHVVSLAAKGFPTDTIAIKAGFGSSAEMTAVLSRHRVAREVAERILAVGQARISRARLVPALGSTRRLQALGALGHSVAALAQHLGVSDPELIRDVQAGAVDLLPWRFAEVVCVAYDRLWDKVGDPYVRSDALQRQWIPPLAWDEEELDDPSCPPDATRLRPISEMGRG